VKRKGLFGYLRKALLASVALVVLLAIAGTAFQSISSRMELANLHPPGVLVDMGGYRLHLHCTGSSTPSDITVVLESGLSSTTSSWARIQGILQAHVRVCSYDRGGVGWSESTAKSRDGNAIAEELHELLRRAGVSGRLVVVGHSSGGLYARSFHERYADQIAGIVLLDSSQESQFDVPAGAPSPLKKVRFAYGILPIAARIGLVRASPLCKLPKDFPAPAREDFHARCSLPESWRAGRSELDALPKVMETLKGRTMGAVPLAVVSAGSDPQQPANWSELQDRLAALSTNSHHVTIAAATHPGLLLDATFAQTCADEILGIVRSSR
jgi:pimeloyl-ACP methyl ester carboxylesterase